MKLRICCLAAALIIGVPALAESLRVMSFNVRYPSKGDGANVWNLRRDLLVSIADYRLEAPRSYGLG